MDVQKRNRLITPEFGKERKVRLTAEMDVVIQGMVAAGEAHSYSAAIRDCALRGLLAQGFSLTDLGVVGQ